jgi:hypothetical protein
MQPTPCHAKPGRTAPFQADGGGMDETPPPRQRRRSGRNKHSEAARASPGRQADSRRPWFGPDEEAPVISRIASHPRPLAFRRVKHANLHTTTPVDRGRSPIPASASRTSDGARSRERQPYRNPGGVLGVCGFAINPTAPGRLRIGRRHVPARRGCSAPAVRAECRTRS